MQVPSRAHQDAYCSTEQSVERKVTFKETGTFVVNAPKKSKKEGRRGGNTTEPEIVSAPSRMLIVAAGRRDVPLCLSAKGSTDSSS